MPEDKEKKAGKEEEKPSPSDGPISKGHGEEKVADEKKQLVKLKKLGPGKVKIRKKKVPKKKPEKPEEKVEEKKEEVAEKEEKPEEKVKKEEVVEEEEKPKEKVKKKEVVEEEKPEEKAKKKKEEVVEEEKPKEEEKESEEEEEGAEEPKEEEAEEEEELEIIEEEEYKVKIKPELSNELKRALKIRSDIKKRTPDFKRQEWFRNKRLGTAWRRPRGLHSKMRKHKGYRQNVVSIGYGSPSKTRNLHPSGFEEVMVFNVRDLEKLDPKSQAARVGHSVGTKKRIEIEEKAEEKGIRVLNPRRL